MHFWEYLRHRKRINYRVIYKHGPSRLAALCAGVALVSWLLFSLLSSYPVFAYAYYLVKPATSQLLSAALRETGQAVAPGHTQTVQAPTTPPKDISLPEGHYLSIPRIGVDTSIWEASTEDYESALKRGVWRVPEFGVPGQTGKPIILAAHRFGYLDWSQTYRLQNSFYNLPKVKVGDAIEFIWDQRKYTYQVTRLVEGTRIDDYSSDLILYTCTFLVSPLRIFVYGTLVP